MDAQTIRQHLDPILEASGFFLVEVKVDKQNRIMIQIDKPEGIQIEDCVQVSRELERRLDRDQEDFALEVSSPGLDSPFRVMEQYHMNVGRMVEVRKQDDQVLRGELLEVLEDGIRIQPETGGKKKADPEVVSLEFREIQSTRVHLDF